MPEDFESTSDDVVDVPDATSGDSGDAIDATSGDAVDAPSDTPEATAPVEDAPEEELDPAEQFRAELRSLPGRWYVVHSYAGYEKRVKQNLEFRIQSLNMEDYIFQVEVPMEEVVEIKNAQRKLVTRVRIPSYVLVRMDMNNDSWGAVRHTPGVTGFVGNSHDPVPLSEDEVFSMLAPRPDQGARLGAEVRRWWREGREGGRGRLRGRRVRHRHRRALRDPARHDLGDQSREPEAQGAGLDLRPRDPGRTLVLSGREDLSAAGSRTAHGTIHTGKDPKCLPRRRRWPG